MINILIYTIYNPTLKGIVAKRDPFIGHNGKLLKMDISISNS